MIGCGGVGGCIGKKMGGWVWVLGGIKPPPPESLSDPRVTQWISVHEPSRVLAHLPFCNVDRWVLDGPTPQALLLAADTPEGMSLAFRSRSHLTSTPSPTVASLHSSQCAFDVVLG